MPTLAKWSPFAELDLLDRRWRRMLEPFGAMPEPLPATDVFETNGEIVFQLEAPGYGPEEIEVAVHEHQLVVKGDRTAEETKEEKTFRLHERLEKHFERRFELPGEADLEHMKAEFAKGVLEIHVPKLAHASSRKIPIGVG